MPVPDISTCNSTTPLLRKMTLQLTLDKKICLLFKKTMTVETQVKFLENIKSVPDKNLSTNLAFLSTREAIFFSRFFHLKNF